METSIDARKEKQSESKKEKELVSANKSFDNLDNEENFGLNVREMAEAGLHLGHKVSNVHPKMKPYIFGVRNSIHIIDLEKTIEKFKETLFFIKNLISKEKTILVVGTKIQTKEIAKKFAKECNLPYIVERWLGGTFTNFDTIKKRIEYFKNLEEKKEKGELEKYTKKERAKIEKELEDLKTKFEGIKNLNTLPDAVFVLDMKKDFLALKEARKMGIKTIGISDTNINPDLADYSIPANDDAVSSVKYILEKVKNVILNTKKEIQNKKTKTED